RMTVVEETRYRNGVPIARTRTSTQYSGAEPDCINASEYRYRHDGRSRRTRETVVVSPCEGEVHAPVVDRFRYPTATGFEHAEISRSRPNAPLRHRYRVPNGSAPQAEASCEDGTCHCWVELRDCDGFPVARVSPGQTVLQYDHCPPT
ncbi:MAG: hypothetical protein AAGF12_38310, partial [Myxococcota bacterium]